jgi:hypothetical protein
MAQIMTVASIKARCVITDDGCWVWQRAKNWDGYGQVRHDGNTRLVHRLTYRLIVGPIPDGLTLDHLCRIRACCNPEHLDPVTLKVNILRADTFQAHYAAQTHCKNNHEFTPENTYIEGSGSRRCRECKRALNRASKARLKARMRAR